MKTVLAEVATRLESVAKVAKVDTDKAPKLSQKYKIHALPTLVLFSKGAELERWGLLHAVIICKRSGCFNFVPPCAQI
jgi:thioredoxin-like negative regulator of GroEL